jgi:hypothetical protein
MPIDRTSKSPGRFSRGVAKSDQRTAEPKSEKSLRSGICKETQVYLPDQNIFIQTIGRRLVPENPARGLSENPEHHSMSSLFGSDSENRISIHMWTPDSCVVLSAEQSARLFGTNRQLLRLR